MFIVERYFANGTHHLQGISRVLNLFQVNIHASFVIFLVHRIIMRSSDLIFKFNSDLHLAGSIIYHTVIIDKTISRCATLVC